MYDIAAGPESTTLQLINSVCVGSSYEDCYFEKKKNNNIYAIYYILLYIIYTIVLCVSVGYMGFLFRYFNWVLGCLTFLDPIPRITGYSGPLTS